MKKTTILVFFIFLVAVLLTSCGLASRIISSRLPQWTPEPTPADISVIIGDVAELDGIAIQVEKIEKYQGDNHNKPKDGYEYVIVTVLVKNVGKTIISYNDSFLKMKNSKGLISSPAMLSYDTMSGYNARLNMGSLMPGGLASGTVTFEQPKDDPGLSLQYDNFGLVPDQKIIVDLNQTAKEIKLLTQKITKVENEKIVNVGEENALGDTTITMNKSQRTAGSQYLQTDSAREVVTVEVTIKNTGKKDIDLYPFQFLMRNSAGELVEDSSWRSKDPSIQNIEGSALAAGASVTGTLYFEQPEGDTGLVLIYKPSDLEPKYLAFRIK